MHVTAAQLLDSSYLQQCARHINPQRAGQHTAGTPASGGTVYLCAADAQGRMVSFIQSNYRGFGSGVVVPGTGIALHNRGTGFVTTPGHPNQVDGGKRPLHSIIPAFLTKDGQPAMAFGVMGGNMQAQGHVQMVLRHVVEGLNPQACADAPRWRINDAAALTLEPTVPPAVVEGLQAMGHTPQVLPPGIHYEWPDLAYQQRNTSNLGLLIFPLSVLFVFLVLTAQYESWSLPLAIVLIVPLCLLFAIVALLLRGLDINILGLIGLASKNAILIVEFARQQESEGKDRFSAATDAAQLRLRPILMTSFAFIAGVLPLMLATGAGAEMRQVLGTVVFGGMLGVTLIGLLLTPVFYTVIRGWLRDARSSATPAGEAQP